MAPVYSIKTGSFCYSEPKKNLDDHFQRKQVAFFSSNSGCVTLDQSQLFSYKIPRTLLNVHHGSSNYIPKTFKNGQSTIGEFLKALSLLEAKTDFSLDKYDLICPSNFFQCCALLKQSEFDVVSYKGKLFIANTDTRESQNAFISYIGIRFEDLITLGPDAPPTRDNKSSYNSIVETEIANMKCIYTCEIDSYNPSKVPSLDSDLINDKAYTEIKMLYSKKIPQSGAKSKDVLKVLRNGNNSFEDFLYRLNVQCRFGNNHNVLVGIRDQSFNIRMVKEFSLKQDIEKCFKMLKNPVPGGLTFQYALGGYDGYVRAIDYIEGVLELIKKAVNSGNDVCKVRIRLNEIDVVPITEESEKRKIVKKVIIKEINSIRLNGKS